MPVFDIEGNPIVHHNDFPNNAEIQHLEVGAGRNCFGKKFFPSCYLTDIERSPLPHFSTDPAYNEEEFEFLDDVVDFYAIGLDRTFQKIICCNPIGFGFQGRETAKDFLTQVEALLETEGELLILGNRSNGWANHHNAQKRLLKIQQDDNLFLNLEISAVTDLALDHPFRVNHTFYRVAVNEVTHVTQMYTIKKIN